MQALLALIAFLLTGTLVPVNHSFRQSPDGIPIYVVSNGFHTDVVLPLHEVQTNTNWLQELHQPTLTAQFARYQYVAFGWGNERFYLESRGDNFPGPKAILGAVFPSSTLMHVDFYRSAPKASARVVPLRISEAQYLRLAAYVRSSFSPLIAWASTSYVFRPGIPPKIFSFALKDIIRHGARVTTGPTKP
ncbi:DUF2459 domain-containing protein [Hymenobacter taeanensis]|uniref:DUF2459 domain-containing protein n=1 Tax=Hymenobacter taeanensis TaxID=2735321 RepID=A0A6M6BK85_9BACT|nr:MULTISPECIES: DUF2459 domain-containing protein [Hymenobacter]QJX48278.1 DUF2459 domain-containing protein [Hymenobacter taeanensis]UOQ82239.1 DUF2459 domain-containing protein [Hymenobacter sp. 5414T-23]